MAIIQVLNLCHACAKKLEQGYRVAEACSTIQHTKGKCHECNARVAITTYIVSKKERGGQP